MGVIARRLWMISFDIAVDAAAEMTKKVKSSPGTWTEIVTLSFSPHNERIILVNASAKRKKSTLRGSAKLTI